MVPAARRSRSLPFGRPRAVPAPLRVQNPKGTRTGLLVAQASADRHGRPRFFQVGAALQPGVAARRARAGVDARGGDRGRAPAVDPLAALPSEEKGHRSRDRRRTTGSPPSVPVGLPADPSFAVAAVWSVVLLAGLGTLVARDLLGPGVSVLMMPPLRGSGTDVRRRQDVLQAGDESVDDRLRIAHDRRPTHLGDALSNAT